MTYGVYSEDLRYCSISEVSLETAKKSLREGKVVCSEQQHFSSFEVRIWFHGWRGFLFNRWDSLKCLGFVSFEIVKHTYTWADKIVAKYVAKKSEANK